jgi:hypothetical protein
MMMFLESSGQRLRRPARPAALAVAGVLLAACSSGSPAGPASPSSTQAGQGGPVKLNAEVASYDLAAGLPTRFTVGLVTGDNQLVLTRPRDRPTSAQSDPAGPAAEAQQR